MRIKMRLWMERHMTGIVIGAVVTMLAVTMYGRCGWVLLEGKYASVLAWRTPFGVTPTSVRVVIVKDKSVGALSVPLRITPVPTRNAEAMIENGGKMAREIDAIGKKPE